ncbi:MAG: hypothetical protein P8Z36_12835 [Gemmatimonadota bacterium]
MPRLPATSSGSSRMASGIQGVLLSLLATPTLYYILMGLAE